MSKIIILIGVAGSGKSTWAFEYVNNNPDTVIVSRDSMRKTLFGYDDKNLKDYYLTEITQTENVISEFIDLMVRKAIKLGKDVIVDNTNLQMSYISHYKNFGVPLQLRFFDVDINDCLERDKNRIKSVGEDIVRKQYRHFSQLKKSHIVNDIEEYNNKLKELAICSVKEEYDATKKDCVVVDIDGTVANGNGRNPFDYKNVMNDLVVTEVRSIVNSIYENYINIIFCSGRENVCAPQTEEWLIKNGFNWDNLYMREKGDHRKDLIVKAEMWEKIQKDYNIIGMIDDRTQVVEFARRLGFKVYQCNEGDF